MENGFVPRIRLLWRSEGREEEELGVTGDEAEQDGLGYAVMGECKESGNRIGTDICDGQ